MTLTRWGGWFTQPREHEQTVRRYLWQVHSDRKQPNLAPVVCGDDLHLNHQYLNPRLGCSLVQTRTS